MKFLISNDDGIDAAGIATLAEAAAALGEVVVVAPNRCYSGCSHQTTIETPLTVTEHGGNRFSCDGTPADCVRLGLLHLARDADWVLSGVNHGGNLGIDTAMSGTVAAVREGVQLGRPGIAFSQFHRGRRHGSTDPFDWPARRDLVRAVLEELLGRDLPAGRLFNVNLPDPGDQNGHVPEFVDCALETGHHAFDYEQVDGKYVYRSRYDERGRADGSDVDVCFSGRVAITRLPALWSD